MSSILLHVYVGSWHVQRTVSIHVQTADVYMRYVQLLHVCPVTYSYYMYVQLPIATNVPTVEMQLACQALSPIVSEMALDEVTSCQGRHERQLSCQHSSTHHSG